MLDTIGTAVGVGLVWFLLTGIAHIAEGDRVTTEADGEPTESSGLTELARRATTARNGIVVGLASSALLTWAAVVFNQLDITAADSVVGGVAVVLAVASALFGLLGLYVIRVAGSRLRFTGSPPRSGESIRRLARATVAVGVVGGLAAITALAVAMIEPRTTRSAR